MKSQIKGKTVYVAMSGGVDSSVAAGLLKKQGFNVVGVFMKPWSPEHDSNPYFCMWKQDREDAMRAAVALNIKFLTWDFSKEYKNTVVNYMIKEYKAGRTPNPDVMCNKEIKFGLFLKKALSFGADFVATGHYVRLKPKRAIGKSKSAVRKSKSRLPVTDYRLLIAKDKNKDQSYFLWTLGQEELKYCIFPIGDYTKPEVRKIAKKMRLPNYDKKDSQGVCFIGQLDMKDFLKSYIKPKPGKIIDADGNVIGLHDGIYYYTIGQRHGLDIKRGNGPYFVIEKDVKKNIIYVGSENKLALSKAKVVDLNWIGGRLKLPAKMGMKIRYRSKSEPGVLKINNIIDFINPVRAITPGQSVVFYRGEKMMGGGIIK